ncbi:hypothetical protein MCHI_001593 [Candidatus Magnetoovum chiemensis]|nr:hypothetical protein MCHI_001593 [Candidatus Magnetoovum chiemensis]
MFGLPWCGWSSWFGVNDVSVFFFVVFLTRCFLNYIGFLLI